MLKDCNMDPNEAINRLLPQEEDAAKIPIKAYFICTSGDMEWVLEDHPRQISGTDLTSQGFRTFYATAGVTIDHSSLAT